ncbi:Unknown protein, partial [Striga hermonthica]
PSSPSPSDSPGLMTTSVSAVLGVNRRAMDERGAVRGTLGVRSMHGGGRDVRTMGSDAWGNTSDGLDRVGIGMLDDERGAHVMKDREVIMEKYYPQGYRMRMERAFWDLTQGTGIVEEYEREFNCMRAFAPHMVDTDLKKAHKFRDGLNQTLCMHVASQGDLLFDETVIRATQLESYQTLNVSAPSAQLVQPISSAPPGSSSGKRKFDSRRDNQKRKCGGNDHRGDRPFARDQFLRCRNCGRYHPGECRYTQRACFNCMKPGHFFSACPEPPRQHAQQQQQQQQQQQLPPPPYQQQQQHRQPPPHQQRAG